MNKRKVRQASIRDHFKSLSHYFASKAFCIRSGFKAWYSFYPYFSGIFKLHNILSSFYVRLWWWHVLGTFRDCATYKVSFFHLHTIQGIKTHFWIVQLNFYWLDSMLFLIIRSYHFNQTLIKPIKLPVNISTDLLIKLKIVSCRAMGTNQKKPRLL